MKFKDQNLIKFLKSMGEDPGSKELFEESFKKGFDGSARLREKGLTGMEVAFPQIRTLELLYRNRHRFPQDSEGISELYQLVKDFLADKKDIRDSYNNWKQDYLQKRKEKGKQNV